MTRAKIAQGRVFCTFSAQARRETRRSGCSGAMPRCSFCCSACESSGDTGGTAQSHECVHDRALLDSLEGWGQGWYRGCRLCLRRVKLGAFSPVDAQALAVNAMHLYPAGVVVIHLERRCACLFRATGAPEALHVGCAVEQLRLRLSVGVVVGREGQYFALKVGKRLAPLLRILRA